MRFLMSLLVVTLAACTLQTAAYANETTNRTPVVRGEIIRDYARVTFEWPRSTFLTAKSEGNSITINFDHKANPDFGKLLSSLSPFITSAEVRDDGKSILLTTDKHYRVRSFTSGNISGVDMLGIDPAEKRAASATTPTPPKPPKTEEAKEATETPPPTESDKKTPLSTEEKLAAARAKSLAPSAGENAETPAPASATEAAPPPAPEPPEKPVVEEPAPEKPAPATASAEIPTPPPLNSTPENAASPQGFSPPTAAGEAEKTRDHVKVFASVNAGKTVLRFAWKERVAAASFVRGNRVWIIFNKRMPLDLSAVQETASALYSRIAQQQVEGATVVAIESDDLKGVLPSKALDSFEWSIVMVGTPQAAADKVRVDVSTDAPLPAHVFIPVTETSPTLKVDDPYVGDSLHIIPSFKAGEGVSPRRNFVEFSLLESAQGLVIKKIADSVSITETRGGIRIGSQKGSPLTPNLPEVEPKQSDAMPPINVPQTETKKPASATVALQTPMGSFFPYEKWRLKEGTTLTEAIQALQAAILDAPNPEEAMKVRMQLAQLYLAEGFSAEAIGVLKKIKESGSEFYIAQRLAALSGAANFLMRRFADAAEDFAATELQGSPEALYWQNKLADLLGNPGQTFDYMANNTPYFSQYPPRLRQQLAIVAADRAVSKTDYNIALQILDTLKTANQLDGIEDYVAFLIAKISLETGKEGEGLEVLTNLAGSYKNLAVRARAELALIQYARKSTPDDPGALLPNIERLNVAWRGDDVELETLKMMAQLHFLKDDYAKAMYAWRDIITLFPSTVAANEALGRMRNTFVTLFKENAADNLPLLDQLALYYEFRSLTPGDETGDAIVNNIVERLVAADLLEQSITLLDYRMRYLFEKEARSRTGARLAEIYLLNNQPDKVIEALQASAYGDNPADLRSHRDRIAARALVEKSEYKDALSLLEQDKSLEAETIRQRIWWEQKEWPKLISSVESELKNRKDITADLTPQEADKLMQLAFAYSAESDLVQLQYLRDYFTPLMKASERAEIFNIVTEPDLQLKPELLEPIMQQIDATRHFLSEYSPQPKELTAMLKQSQEVDEANAAAAKKANEDQDAREADMERRKQGAKRREGHQYLEELEKKKRGEL